MTQVVAVVTEGSVILAGDTLCGQWVGVLGDPGTFTQQPGPKVFAVGGHRYGVLTFGESPYNAAVPAVIAAHAVAADTETMARDFAATFLAGPKMGLFVAGYENNRPVLIRVCVGTQSVGVVGERIACGGVFTDPTKLKGYTDPTRLSEVEAAALAEAMILDVAARFPGQVGAPVEILSLTAAGSRWVTQSPGLRG